MAKDSKEIKDTYTTLSGPGEGNFRDKGSKFLAFAYPVRNEEEIQFHLDALQETYYDARHHCYAWRLGPEGQPYRANDAGEPNHSAGTPILNEIRSRDLSDVLVVVVRYFGGTKLGIPGLIEAYGASAAEALDAAPRISRTLTEPVSIVFSYPQTSEVGRVLQKFSLKPSHQEFGADCRQTFEVRLRDHAAVVEVFREMGILAGD